MCIELLIIDFYKIFYKIFCICGNEDYSTKTSLRLRRGGRSPPAAKLTLCLFHLNVQNRMAKKEPFSTTRQIAAKDELPKELIEFHKSTKYSYETSGAAKIYFKHGEKTVWLSETVATQFYNANSAKEELLCVLRGDYVVSHRNTPKKGYDDEIYSIQAKPASASKYKATTADLDAAWDEL